MRFVLFFFILLMSEMAFAYKPDKCFKFVHGNAIRKYDYPGNFSSEYMTKKHGTTYGPTEATQQRLTALSDPFVLFGYVTSTSQFSTSWGACDYFAFRKEMRQDYIVKNEPQVKQQIAMGRGGHLQAVHYYSACEPSSEAKFKQVMQNQFSYLQNSRHPANLVEGIDLIILADPELRGACEII